MQQGFHKIETYSFHTKKNKDEAIKFLVYGDSRSFPKIHENLINLMETILNTKQ
jgi:hypothetical protein